MGDGKGWFWLAVGVVGLAVIVGGVFGGIYLFKDPTYEAVTRISYSTDDGYNYREGIRAIDVTKEYYMLVEMQVVSSKDINKKTIKANITLEQTEVVTCYLDGYPGQNISGVADTINKTVTYTFDIQPSTSPSKFRVTFQCVPAAVGTFKTIVEYDSKLDPSWDKTEIIRYVEHTSDELNS